MRQRTRVAILALALLAGPIAATPGSPASAQTASGHGLLLMAHSHTMSLRDLATGVERDLFTLPNADFPRSPVWLPDGSGFYYVDQAVNTGLPGAQIGSDIWRSDASGANRTRIWQHDVQGADLDGLALTPDGSALIYGYTLTQVNPDGTIAGQVVRLDHLDLASGAVQHLRDGAVDPAVAADGTIAYVDTSGAPAIWALPPDDSPPRLLLASGTQFLSFFLPRFSPDGAHLLFAAAPAAGGAPGPAMADYDAVGRPLDGPAQDVFSVATDGSGTVLRLTNIQEDQPSAGWSADGTHAVVVGSEGVFLAAADGSGVVRLGDGYLHTQAAWLDR